MKAAVVVSPGLEELAGQEIAELLQVKTSRSGTVLQFSCKKREDLLQLMFHAQAITRLLLLIGEITEKGVSFSRSFPFSDFFVLGTFTVDILQVAGQENRTALLQKVVPAVTQFLAKKDCTLTFAYKNPDFRLVAVGVGEKRFLGLDFCGRDLSVREYRLFPHAASLRGDVGYFFVRASGFQKNERLLVGFCKDGTLAIEAALYAQQALVQNTKQLFSFQKFPCYSGVSLPALPSSSSSEQAAIFAFDQSSPNVTATRKNARLARVAVDVQKCALEDLDVKFSQGHFHRLIFHVTRKDEEKINELYYQAGYLLPPGGTLLLIGRKNWEVSVSSPFSLIASKDLQRGESVYKYWLLQRKAL